MDEPRTVSFHVNDVAEGKPAAGIYVSLYRRSGSDWVHEVALAGNEVGRGEIPPDVEITPGTYRLIFDLEKHYKQRDLTCRYPRVQAEFTIFAEDVKLHVVLSITRFMYTVNQGS